MSGDDQTGQDAPNTGPTLTHPQCINRLQSLRDAMSQIAELEKPSAEDDRYFGELTDEFDTVDAHRMRLERDAQLARIKGVADNLSASRHLRAMPGAYGNASSNGDSYDRDAILEPDSIQAQRFRNPWDLSEVRTFGRTQEQLATEYRARALSAVQQMPSANDTIRSAATDLIERWDDEGGRLSQLALALSEPTYLRAWSKLARDPHAAELDNDERRSVSRVKTLARAMSLTDSAGGYLVPFQLDPTVIITANGSVNQIRQVCRQVVAIGDVWNGVSAGAVSWSYDAEAAEVSDDAPTFAQPSIPIYKAQGFVPISIEAFQDSANVAQEVGRLLAFGKDVLEANAFAVGTGIGMPTGIVTALTGTSSVVTSTTTDVFALGDLYKVHGALPARYRNMPSTAWMGNTLTYNLIRQFDTAGGAGLWATLGDGTPDRLLNKTVIEAEDMDGTINAGADNYTLIFGDFSNFVIADRIGTTVEFIPHLFHTANNRPSGQRGWLAYVRHGSDSVSDGSFRLLNIT